ncbi:hypothetical protein F7O84_07595 [Candidatus Galacturonibacter soehngenii]|uniref:Condensation domain-containing protein n=2 Tax=Candidatus Galacturonatibacter soehngenii TaxID=2307010 RepID=A0A7V7QIU6_9FIRM|nr:hypothetical protein F7O84_07595 [Candidatus Galacturonibacter soehngenii]
MNRRLRKGGGMEKIKRVKIDKERTWVFSPVSNIAFKVDIGGRISQEQLKKAIKNTIQQYEMFHQKIVLDESGIAYYEETNVLNPTIRPMNLEWSEVIKEQEKIPLRIDQGELIRFFYSQKEECMSLLIVAHHIAGDGMSFIYFLQDILRSLAGRKIEYKKLQLFDMDALPKKTKLQAPTTWLKKHMNKQWSRTGRKFDFEEYYQMYKQCWKNRETLVYTYQLKEENYDLLYQYAKANQVTINTLLTTALIKVSGELCDVGMAASIREKDFTGMGNYATGISIKYKYKEKYDFLWNAKMVQKRIYSKLNNTSKKYFLLQFMRNIEPTLIDAVYFNACGNYENKIAKTFSKMFGYDGNPKGISITNLTQLPIESKYNDIELKDLIFIPPIVLNAKRIIGVASLGKNMRLSLHINNDENVGVNSDFFYKAMEFLTNEIGK